MSACFNLRSFLHPMIDLSAFFCIFASPLQPGPSKLPTAHSAWPWGPPKWRHWVELTRLVRQGSSGTRSPHRAAWIRAWIFGVSSMVGNSDVKINDVQKSWKTSDTRTQDSRFSPSCVCFFPPCCWVMHHSVSQHDDVKPRINKTPVY